MTFDGVENSEVLKKAMEYYQRKDYKEVLRIFQEAESNDSISEDLVVLKSATLIRLQRWNETIDFIRSKLPEYPDNAKLHGNLSTAYFTKWKFLSGERELKVTRSLDESVARRLGKIRIYRYSITVALPVYFALVVVFWPGSRFLLIPLMLFFIAGAFVLFINALRKKPRKGAFVQFIILLIILFICFIATALIATG